MSARLRPLTMVTPAVGKAHGQKTVATTIGRARHCLRRVVRVGLKRIVPPLQGSGLRGAPLTQAFSLGFVISPLWGSNCENRTSHHSPPVQRTPWVSGSAALSCGKAPPFRGRSNLNIVPILGLMLRLNRRGAASPSIQGKGAKSRKAEPCRKTGRQSRTCHSTKISVRFRAAATAFWYSP